MSRLIDAEALKNEVKGLFCTDGYIVDFVKIIDNAPTVTEISTNDIEYKAYCRGLEDGKKITRNTGKWIDAEFEGRGIYNTPLGTTDGNITIHGFRCNNCRIFSHSKDRYCSHCGFFMTNYI